MRVIRPIRYSRRVLAVMVCGAALSTASMLAQDNAAPPPPAGQTDGMGPGGMGPGGHGGRGREEHQLERMTKQLSLTPDQVTQVKAIEDDSRTKARALHEDTSVSPDEKRPKMMALREDTQTKIRGILNPDQQTKFDAMEARMREHMQERGNHQGGPAAPPAQ